MPPDDDLLTMPSRPDDPPADGQQPAPVLALPPLAVSALMVTKADLITALRVYLPHLVDIEMIDDQRFLLSVGPHVSDDNGSA